MLSQPFNKVIFSCGLAISQLVTQGKGPLIKYHLFEQLMAAKKKRLGRKRPESQIRLNLKLNIHVVLQSWEHVNIGPPHDGTLSNQCQDRPETNRVQLTREDVGQHDDSDGRDVAGPLRDDGRPLQEAESQDIGQVIVRVHDDVAALVDRHGDRYPE